MKRLMLGVALTSICAVAIAQDSEIELNVNHLLSNPWKSIASTGSKIYSYQINHSVQYNRSITPQNKNLDVVIKIGSRGPSGTVSSTSLVVATVTCYPTGEMDDRVYVIGYHEYPSGPDGKPDNPSDESFIIYPNNGEVESVEFSSPIAKAGKDLCHKT